MGTQNHPDRPVLVGTEQTCADMRALRVAITKAKSALERERRHIARGYSFDQVRVGRRRA